MKGKKCIKYLILCITFLLSLNPFLNANAINIEDTTTYSSASWIYNPGNLTQTANFYSSYYLRGITFTHRYTQVVSRASNLELTLGKNVNISKSKKFRFKVIYKVYSDFNSEYLSVFPMCPRGTNNYVIDKCELSNADQNSIIKYLGNIDVVIGDNITAKPIYGDQVIYYIMQIEGHYNSTNDKSTNKIITTGNYFSMFSSDAQLNTIDYTAYLDLAFSPFEVFTEDNTEQEAAEKELEDRDNLETQQGETESSAGDSSDSFESSTTNITGVISGFVTSLNNLQVGNCTLPEISAYGFSLGNINLCTFTPPTWIQGVTTVIISLITLGLAWHIFKRIMGIAKNIAGSK